MTDKAQQPEYIITEEQLRNNADVLCLDDIMKIRSRPHTPAPDPITADEVGDMCDQVAEVAGRAATLAENTRVLDAIEAKARENSNTETKPSFRVYQMIKGWCKALRQQQEREQG
jgi:hypothetical protein